MSFAGRTIKALAPFVGFWTVLLFGLLLVSLELDDSTFHSKSNWKPIDVNPSVFLAAAAALLICVALLVYFGWNSKRRQFASSVILAFLLVSLAFAVAAITPGRGSLAIRDSVDPADPLITTSTFGIPILFENGSDRIDAAQQKVILSIMSVFRECETYKVVAKGFASSAPYKNDSDNMTNLYLANRRANTVATFLRDHGFMVIPLVWNSYGSMKNNKRVVDTLPDGLRDVKEEVRNRRVELLWHESPCSGL